MHTFNYKSSKVLEWNEIMASAKADCLETHKCRAGVRYPLPQEWCYEGDDELSIWKCFDQSRGVSLQLFVIYIYICTGPQMNPKAEYNTDIASAIVTSCQYNSHSTTRCDDTYTLYIYTARSCVWGIRRKWLFYNRSQSHFITLTRTLLLLYIYNICPRAGYICTLCGCGLQQTHAQLWVR